MTTPIINAVWLEEFISWNFATFGPGRRTEGTIDHIRKELIEIETNPTDPKEWADIVLLALNGMARLDLSPEQIIKIIIAKQAATSFAGGRTEKRDPLKAVEHIREADTFNPFGPDQFRTPAPRED
ncbi:MAG: DUF550 domain-containing protein [Brucella anthropi]